MSLRFLLDTNILFEPTKKYSNSNVLEKLRQHRSEIGTCSIVWHEPWFGCQHLSEARKRQKLEYYLTNVVENTIPLLPYDVNSNLQLENWYDSHN